MTTPRYADFWRQLLATIIGCLLLMPVLGLLLQLAHGTQYWGWTEQQHASSALNKPADVIINYLVPLALTVLLWVRFRASPGKLILGCGVGHTPAGRRLDVGQAVLHWLTYFVSALPLCLGCLWIALDSRKQGFHDKIASSIVIRKSMAGAALLPPSLDEVRRGP